MKERIVAMKRTYAIYALIAILLISCEREVPLSGEEVVVNLVAGDTRGDEVDKDDAIDSFRVLVYESYTKKLAYTQYVSDISSSGDYPVTLNMKTGMYDFVFIANEKSTRFAYQVLNNISIGAEYSGLGAVAFNDSDFSEEKNIPMATIIKGVRVMGTNKIKLPGATDYTEGTWNVELKRAGVRVNLTVTMTKEQWEASEKVLRIEGIPSTMMLLPEISINRPVDRFRELPFPQADIRPDQSAVINFPRIILPEKVISPVNDASRGLVFKLQFGDVVKEYVLDVSDNNYSIPRNTYLEVEATVQNFDFSWSTTVYDWNEVLLTHGI